MDNEQKNKQPEKDESEPYTFSDEVTKNKIEKHIKDIDDVITDEDIARVKVPGEETPPAKSEEKKEEKKGDEQPEGPAEGKPTTPWDILD